MLVWLFASGSVDLPNPAAGAANGRRETPACRVQLVFECFQLILKVDRCQFARLVRCYVAARYRQCTKVLAFIGTVTFFMRTACAVPAAL